MKGLILQQISQSIKEFLYHDRKFFIILAIFVVLLHILSLFFGAMQKAQGHTRAYESAHRKIFKETANRLPAIQKAPNQRFEAFCMWRYRIVSKR